MSKKISMYTECSAAEIQFLVGKAIGERETHNEVLIFVVSDPSKLPSYLAGWFKAGRMPLGVEICHGVTNALETAIKLRDRWGGPEMKLVHMLYLMDPPAVEYDEEVLAAGCLPMYIASQAIQRQMMDPAVNKVTFFLEE